jgi:nicotinamidase-related amidase
MSQSPQLLETLEAVIQPRHTALLVIDVQNDFYIPKWEEMLPRLKRVIEAARSAGAFVVYIQNVVLLNELSNSAADVARRRKHNMKAAVTVDGTRGCQFAEQIAPQPNDPIVRKHRMNSFLGTSLDLLLRNRGIKTVVCTGTATHGCVINTAYAAVMSDYYVVVVEDCVSAGRADLHDASLILLKSAMHHVINAADVVDVWKQGSRSPSEPLVAANPQN